MEHAHVSFAQPWLVAEKGQRRAGSIAGAMPHVRVAGVAQQQQPSRERSTSMAVVCAPISSKKVVVVVSRAPAR